MDPPPWSGSGPSLFVRAENQHLPAGLRLAAVTESGIECRQPGAASGPAWWGRRGRPSRCGAPGSGCSVRATEGRIEGVDDPVLPGVRHAGRAARAGGRVHRPPLRHLRRRERLPLSLGGGVLLARGGRGVGDGGVHRRPRRRSALCLSEGCPQMGLIDTVELPQPIKFIFNWGRKYSLWVFNFGLACCAIEFIATSM